MVLLLLTLSGIISEQMKYIKIIIAIPVILYSAASLWSLWIDTSTEVNSRIDSGLFVIGIISFIIILSYCIKIVESNIDDGLTQNYLKSTRGKILSAPDILLNFLKRFMQNKSKWIHTNRFKITAIVITLMLFYWFSIRPSNIRKTCVAEYGIGHGYEYCLHENGL